MNENLLFASTSANLYNFLNHEETDKHIALYRAIVNSGFQAHRETLSHTIDNLNIVDESGLTPIELSKSVIYISFHTGSYNLLIPHLFLQKGYKTLVLADNGSMEVEEYLRAEQYYKKEYNRDCTMEIINVQQPKSIFRIVRAIREGYAIVAFIDGNKGTDGQTLDNDNLIQLNFLKGIVKVRKGLPFIAHMTNTPIVLGLNYEENNQKHLKFHPAIRPKSNENKQDFCQRSLTQVFTDFGNHVFTYTDQWSNWPYLHNWAILEYFDNQDSTVHNPTETVLPENLAINYVRYCPLKLNNGLALFDRSKYTLIPIERNSTLARLLSQRESASAKEDMIRSLHKNAPETFLGLLKAGILH